MPDTHPELVNLLREAEAILVFTGAGISTRSGIPDFRGPQGVWKTQQPVYYHAFMNDEAARLTYWKQKSEGWELIRDAQPNGVHRAVAQLEAAGKMERVVTQNIDGLHFKAGTSREKLVELHGTNLEVECQGCLARSDPEPAFAFFRKRGEAPLCEQCGGFLKPATISFGQNLRQADLERAFDATRACDLVIAMGSTLSVTPAAMVPSMAADAGAKYVIINQGPTEHDGMPELTLRLEGDVEELLPPAVEAALG